MADASNAQVLHKTVIESTHDFTNGDGATSQALNAIDQVRRCAGERLPHLDGLFRSLDGSEGGGKGTSTTTEARRGARGWEGVDGEG